MSFHTQILHSTSARVYNTGGFLVQFVIDLTRYFEFQVTITSICTCIFLRLRRGNFSRDIFLRNSKKYVNSI